MRAGRGCAAWPSASAAGVTHDRRAADVMHDTVGGIRTPVLERVGGEGGHGALGPPLFVNPIVESIGDSSFPSVRVGEQAPQMPVIPAKAGIHLNHEGLWIPAFAGMTTLPPLFREACSPFEPGQAIQRRSHGRDASCPPIEPGTGFGSTGGMTGLRFMQQSGEVSCGMTKGMTLLDFRIPAGAETRVETGSVRITSWCCAGAETRRDGFRPCRIRRIDLPDQEDRWVTPA